MKIYVASSWRNSFQPLVVSTLRGEGHEVYDFRNPGEGDHGFSWSQIDEQWENWDTEQYVEALKHPIALKGFKSDFDAMKWADVCVMVLPCGRSANTEAGWMKGAGKKVFVVSPIPQEPELMYKLYDGIFSTPFELKKALDHIREEKQIIDGQRMREIANVIKAMIPKGTAFALLTFPFGSGERMGSYISNACREDMEKAMEETLASWKARKDFPTPEAN